MAKKNELFRVVFWGTYDMGKPRVRLLLAGARSVGMEVLECHYDIWKGIEDKSQLSGSGNKFKILLSWFFAYPSLIWRYLRLPSHDAVIVGYMGQLDVLVLRPFASLRGVPIVWDAFLSLYNTVVKDRHIVSRYSPIAWLLYVWEWLACRAADKIFLDTKVHARYFERLFKLQHESIGRVFVGAETDFFSKSSSVNSGREEKKTFTVLFYGQFIPLHGIDVIIKAAKKVEMSNERVHWVIIGQGQEKERIEALIQKLGITSIERIAWVSYDHLVNWIQKADVCLGIFGTSGKASRVIPNKVYQILAARRPLITADTPAIRELLHETSLIRLVPPGDAGKLAEAVIKMKKERSRFSERAYESQGAPIIGSVEVGKQLLEFMINNLSVRN